MLSEGSSSDRIHLRGVPAVQNSGTLEIQRRVIRLFGVEGTGGRPLRDFKCYLGCYLGRREWKAWAKLEKARLSDGPDDSAIYFYFNARTPFSPNFHIRFLHTPTLFDCHVGLADALPDRHVGGTGAVFAA